MTRAGTDLEVARPRALDAHALQRAPGAAQQVRRLDRGQKRQLRRHWFQRHPHETAQITFKHTATGTAKARPLAVVGDAQLTNVRLTLYGANPVGYERMRREQPPPNIMEEQFRRHLRGGRGRRLTSFQCIDQGDHVGFPGCHECATRRTQNRSWTAKGNQKV